MKKTFVEGYHKVMPVMAINKYNSRFAYRIFVNNKPIAGLWTLDSVDVNAKTSTYKKYVRSH